MKYSIHPFDGIGGFQKGIVCYIIQEGKTLNSLIDKEYIDIDIDKDIDIDIDIDTVSLTILVVFQYSTVPSLRVVLYLQY